MGGWCKKRGRSARPDPALTRTAWPIWDTMPDGNLSESGRPLRVHNFGYTTGMDDSQTQLSVRDARAHFAEVITRAQGGTPTIITRNGQAVAAVVPIEDFNALEDAIDRYFAREADRDLADNPDAPTYSMSEVVAAIFEEEPGKGVA
jgi:prevent-host-death family protein